MQYRITIVSESLLYR